MKKNIGYDTKNRNAWLSKSLNNVNKNAKIPLHITNDGHPFGGGGGDTEKKKKNKKKKIKKKKNI